VGPLDAVVVWNFVARLYQDRVALAPLLVDCPPVRVTVLGLTNSPNTAAREAFLDLCAAPAARSLFEQHGYGAAPIRPP